MGLRYQAAIIGIVHGAVAWELLVKNPVSGSTPEVLRFTVPLIHKPLTTHFLETIEHYTLRS
jgi:hypothetical protein